MSIRAVLAGFLAAAAMTVFPAFASASITPSLAINQLAGNAAGSAPATAFNIKFSPLDQDSVRDMTLALPAGFLINLQIDGGSCFAFSTANANCQIGTADINGSVGSPVNMYLIAPPRPADVAGVLLEGEGQTIVGDLTFSSTPELGFDVSLSNLPPGIRELQFALTDVRLPTSCRTTAENVTLGADSWLGSSGTASAPLTVSNCASLPYAPTVAATVTKQSQGNGASVVVTFTQGAGEAASSSLAFGIPTGLKVNRALVPCLQGTKCTIGTVTATSPLLPPSALASGTLTLGASVSQSSASLLPEAGSKLTMIFPAPYPFQVVGPLDFTEKMITFSGLPDIPLSTISITFAGTENGPAFTTACKQGTIAAVATPQGAASGHRIAGAVTNVGCPPPAPKPSASGSLTGMESGSPKLALTASRASNGPALSSLAIALPAGLSFQRKAIVTHRVCRETVTGRMCKKSVSVRGLSTSGVRLKGARIEHGELLVSFANAVPTVSLTAHGPLLTQGNANENKAEAPSVRLLITDASGHNNAVSVP